MACSAILQHGKGFLARRGIGRVDATQGARGGLRVLRFDAAGQRIGNKTEDEEEAIQSYRWQGEESTGAA